MFFVRNGYTHGMLIFGMDGDVSSQDIHIPQSMEG